MMDIRSLSSLSTGRFRKNLFRYQGSKGKCAWFRQASQLAPKEVAKQRDDGIQSEPLRDHLDVTHPTLSLRSAGPHDRAKTAAKLLASPFPGESPYCFSQTVSLVKCLPSLVKFASTLLALIRLVETVCAPLGMAPIVGWSLPSSLMVYPYAMGFPAALTPSMLTFPEASHVRA